MSESSAAKLSARKAENEAVLARRTARPDANATEANSISQNPIFQLVMNSSVTPEAKSAELRKMLTATSSKVENAAALKAMDDFKAWAQDQRERMASALLEMTDDKTYAELQKTYKDINEGLDNFNKDMEPLLKIVDAVYKIRTASPTGTVDAYQAIKAAQAAEAEHENKMRDVETRLTAALARADELQKSIASEGTKKGLFGFGGITKEAQANIATMNVDLTNILADIDAIQKEKETLEKQASATLGAGTDLDPEALNTLREMLDLSSDEHTARQQSLIRSARDFISTTKERVTSITGHLKGQDERLDKINDANSRMTMLYAMLSEASDGGKKDTLAMREQLLVAPEGETKIAKMEREEKLRALDEFIERLETTTVDTDLTYTDLATGSIRINSMRQANRNQINKAQTMQTRGIAGVADRLVTTVQAVASAAINEAQAAAVDTTRAMMDTTNRIAQNEVIKNATGLDEMNDDLKRAFDDMAAYRDVATTAGEISRAALTEMRENLEAARAAAEEVQESARQQISAASDTLGVKAGEGTITKKNIPTGGEDFFNMKSA